ncbi:hypothetical protein [Candidatus Mycolicibacterium alkanivorans]|uniref:Uncharacterized protein n=1 Tax=Candidatus Mycolicibacterium alkanivorans TaxID=2954114 RepID=A0ABS9YX44_9MYCO|nr:hypothetical protein [Candidatus Mycolicibacterium alkanivorans]MCI4675668.1 hypothetical protein [Candidatus Mycolicibacterium alkanivorans]
MVEATSALRRRRDHRQKLQMVISGPRHAVLWLTFDSETSELEVSDKPLGRPADEELVDLDTDAEFCRDVDDDATSRTIRTTIQRRQIDRE